MDYSGARPLDAYRAVRCPVRLQYDLLPPPGTVAIEPSVADRERMVAGQTFQAGVFARLLDLHDDIVVVEPGWNAHEHTVAAMKDAVGIILGAVLPDDLVGRRSGRPDILLRSGTGYVPVDVKSHGITEAKAGPVSVSSLEAPWDSSAILEPDLRFKRDREHDDALQLAHYWRMLEHHGYADGSPRGAILDRRERIWWIPLDEPRASAWWLERPATWLERYDHEFDFRRDIALETQRRIDGAELSPKVEPAWVSECGRCPWRDVCHVQLLEIDHVSLLPGSTWERFVDHRRRGSLTRDDVARLDVLTAQAVTDLTDAMWSKVETATDDAPLAELLPRRPGLIGACAADGVTTAGELRTRLDDRTLAYRDAHVGPLVTLIDTARAAVSGPHRRRGVTALPLPPAAVEVDVDMECDASGLQYLWGMLPSVEGMAGGYLAVDSYDLLTDEVEAEVFVRFLGELARLREEAVRRGGQLRVYHWTGAELSAMRRIVAKQAIAGLPTRAELDAMIADEWVDLAAVYSAVVVTGSGNSIKVVAPSIGFTWDVDDAGGDFSMVQHSIAVAGPLGDRSSAVDWLRTYNRGDVRATYEIRTWLREHFASLPRIEDWQG
jgi:predicted RecB family nuclease